MTQIIWTNHLEQRIRERHLDPHLVDQAIRYPDRVEKSKYEASEKHIKTINGVEIVAAVKRQGNDWIVTSVWKKDAFSKYSYRSPWPERFVLSLVVGIEKLIRSRFNR